MATRSPITLYEASAETLVVTITPVDPADDLSLVTLLDAVIKDGPCVADTAAGVVHLTSANPTQVVITTHTAALIVAEVSIPVTVTATTYPRWWHLDAYVGAARRTAAYGPVTIVDI